MWIAVIGLAVLGVVSGLTDVKETIPDYLQECYNNSQITTRDNLLPFTVGTLIALIRKIEDTFTSDMRILTSAISQRFRFDGILQNPELDFSNPYVIPYGPKGTEFKLYKMLVERMMPSTQSIPNNTLTYKERCTLHYMLSLAIDPYDRGDNNAPCSRLQKYSGGSSWNSIRFPRDTAQLRHSDVEEFDPIYVNPSYSGGQAQSYQQLANYPIQFSQCPLESGVIYNKYGTFAPGLVLAGLATGLQPQNVNIQNLLSLTSPRLRRPTTSGRQPFPGGFAPPAGGGFNPRPGQVGRVVFGDRQTTGGGYQPSGGGYQPQGGYQPNYGGGGYGGVQPGYPSNSWGTIDNRYAVTLSGLLAEVALLLGPTVGHSGPMIGMSGGWNDSAIPKYYFIQNYNKDGLTDPRLRGGLDGLLLAKEISKYSGMGSLKLSQVLGMYYSEKGFFGTSTRACSRRDHIDEVASNTDLQENCIEANKMEAIDNKGVAEMCGMDLIKFNKLSALIEFIDSGNETLNPLAYNFATALTDYLPESGTITSAGIHEYVTSATDEAIQYISNTMTERCQLDPRTTSTASQLAQSPAVDLHVVIDPSYDFKDMSKILAYLADNLDVSKYSSNFSVISGSEGRVLIDSVQSPLEVYNNFTIANYSSVGRGFDFDKLLSALRLRFQSRLRTDQAVLSGGGNGRAVLFIPQASANLNNKDDLIWKVKQFQVKVPDVKFYFLTSGSKDKFSSFVDEPDKDIFLIGDLTNNIASTLDPVIQRISQTPKRLINPNCGVYWAGGWYSAVTVKGYLEKPEVHHYKVHPNYFYKDTPNARVTIRNDDTNQVLTVCSGRRPTTSNSSNSGGGQQPAAGTCTQLSGRNSKNFWISSSDCPNSYATQCEPWYFSISADMTVTPSISITCPDSDCEYPNMIKYSIEHQGLTCYSGAGRLIGLPVLALLLFNVIQFLQ